jgi:lipopolysaccharide transport system ATP-binding protein
MSMLPKGTAAFDHVSKRFRLGSVGAMREAAARLRGQPVDPNRTLWAIRDVSFTARPGDSLGLVGPNGAGKTTTLKLLSHITQPTSGAVRVVGRVSSLIELGAGFHPELTGRENVFLNGAILGMKRGEIQRRIDDIVAFAELERFVDTPVKRYSSGMYVRLGFAVAAHVQPDILLVDEVLAVGDSRFRHRCLTRMRQLREAGTTILFVSHNMHLVRSTCTSALLLVKGQVASSGTPDEVISDYEKALLAQEADSINTGVGLPDDQHAGGALALQRIWFERDGRETTGVLATTDPVTLVIEYQTTGVTPIGRIDIRVLRQDATVCSVAESQVAPELNPEDMVLEGHGHIRLEYLPVQLAAGNYYVSMRVTDPSDNLVMASAQSEVFSVHAEGHPDDRGVFVPRVRWRIEREHVREEPAVKPARRA